MEERSYVNALLGGKCPRCRKGDLFVSQAADLRHFFKMHDTCPNCGVRLQPEPGFYQGAMYVGYAFTVAAMLVVGVTLYLLADPAEWVYIVTIIGVMLVLAPLNFRYSRIVYLYAFGGIRYDPRKTG